MTELAIRLVFSLAIVVGLLLLIARVAGRRFQGRTGAAIQVLHRQPLSRGSGVAVVTVGDRVLVLGTTEQQVTLLTELEQGELVLDQPEPPARPATGATAPAEPAGSFEEQLQDNLLVRHHETALGQDLVADLVRVAAAEEPRVRAVPTHRAAPQRTKDGALAGSVLSPETWRQALRVARGNSRVAS